MTSRWVMPPLSDPAVYAGWQDRHDRSVAANFSPSVTSLFRRHLRPEPYPSCIHRCGLVHGVRLSRRHRGRHMGRRYESGAGPYVSGRTKHLAFYRTVSDAFNTYPIWDGRRGNGYKMSPIKGRRRRPALHRAQLWIIENIGWGREPG